MNTLKYYTLNLMSAALLILGFGGCEDRPPEGSCPACPVITSIEPSSARAFETITINGRNFGGFKPSLDNVTIDGVELLPVNTEEFTDAKMQFMIPEELASGKKEPLTVRVQIGNLTSDEGEGSSIQHFEYAYPEITEMQPNHGRIGDVIIIKGSNFDPIASNNIIKFGEIPAEVVEATEDKLEVIVPENVQTGSVFLEVAGFTLEGPVFSYNTVVITALEPDNGRQGEVILLKGLFFDQVAENNHVTFFEELEAEVIKANDTILQVIVPEGAKTGPVIVEVDGFNAADRPTFTYNTVQIASLEPDNGKSGEIITIKGQYFDTVATQNVVKFGELPATVTAVTDTTLKVEIPEGAKSGQVSVRSSGFTADKKLNFTYNSVQVTALVPDNGRDGETIIIKGKFFNPKAEKNEVKFGELAAEVTAATDSTLKVVVPQGADTGPVTVKVEEFIAANKPKFTYNGVQVTRLVPDNGREGETITIKGQFFSATPAENTVNIGNLKAEVKAATDSTLQVVIPQGAQTGVVTVEVKGRTATNQPNFTYNIVVVTSLEPKKARHGETVRITGNFFATNPAANKVQIGNTEIPVKSATETELQIEIPKGISSSSVTVEVESRVAVNRPNFTYEFTPIVSTISGKVETPGSINGDMADASFGYPYNIAVDGQNNIFVTDGFPAPSRIRKIDLTGSIVSTFAGSTTSGFADGIGENALFNAIRGITTDGNDNIYVVEQGNRVVRKIDKNSKVELFAGSEREAGAEDGDRFQARFDQPFGLSLDPEGNIFVAELGNRSIRKVSTSGRVSTFKHTGDLEGFFIPAKVTIAPNGSVYCAFLGKAGIYKITSSDIPELIAGDPREDGDQDGIGTTARFGTNPIPKMGTDGYLYIVDPENNKIRRMDLASNEVITFAGTGIPGSSDGKGDIAEFRTPQDIVQDANGNLYVADMDNHLIRKIILE